MKESSSVNSSHRLVAVASLAPLLAAGAPAAASAHAPELRTYQVTLENLTHGQPFSPPVAATTRQSTPHMFQVGHLASRELESIAEDGNEAPMFDLSSQARDEEPSQSSERVHQIRLPHRGRFRSD